MTPYEVFFFSSGAVEEGWSRADLITNRLNVYIGFPLGGLLSLALMAGATLFLEPRGIQPGHLSQVALPTVLVLGKLGLAVLLVGFFAATFGPRWRLACRAATRSPSTSGSSGASSSARRMRPGSIWWRCCRCCWGRGWC
jgi:hypothetical protein